MDTVKAAREALAAGGYLSVCGNAARYRHPQKAKPGKIALREAQTLLTELEEFACGANWPYPYWYRLPPNAQVNRPQKAAIGGHDE